jgi:hypothetical protein
MIWNFSKKKPLWLHLSVPPQASQGTRAISPNYAEGSCWPLGLSSQPVGDDSGIMLARTTGLPDCVP